MTNSGRDTKKKSRLKRRTHSGPGNEHILETLGIRSSRETDGRISHFVETCGQKRVVESQASGRPEAGNFP